MVAPWSPWCQDSLLQAAQGVGKQHLCGEDTWEQISTSAGLTMCKAVVSGKGIMARVCKETASVVSAQLFLESAQLPPRDSWLFARWVTHARARTPKGGCSPAFGEGDIFLEV